MTKPPRKHPAAERTFQAMAARNVRLSQCRTKPVFIVRCLLQQWKHSELAASHRLILIPPSQFGTARYRSAR